MDKKYKILKNGRIEALRSFENVNKGDIGGFVDSDMNLSHDGTCWVFNSARVSGDARVSDSARVSGDAEVSDSAWVSDSARVSGDAEVSDSAWVYGSAWVSDSARVSGDAEVSDSARVFDSAQIFDSARVSGNARVFGIFKTGNCPVYVGTKHNVSYSGIINDEHYISIGCITKSLQDWKNNYRKIGNENGYSESEIDEYGYYLSIIEMIIKRDFDKK